MQELTHHDLPLVERCPVGIAKGGRFAFFDQAILDQLLRVEGTRGLHLLDALIHLRLRHHGLIGLVMAMPPVTDQIDNDIIVKR